MPNMIVDHGHGFARPRRSSDITCRDSFDSDELTVAGSDGEMPFLLEKDVYTFTCSQAFSYWILNQSRPFLPTTHLSTWPFMVRATLNFLLPSFLHRRPASPPQESGNTNIAALDGLRGLACLFVFNEHLSYNFSTTFLWGYDVNGLRTPVQLPFIRIMWSGFTMVSIFFVISGYVLSYKPLKQFHAGDTAASMKTISSSVFRRAFRLYLPTIAAIMICGLLVTLGAFDYATTVFHQDDNAFGLHENPPTIFDSFHEQMWSTVQHALAMLNFWPWTDDLSAGDYDRHYWTIPVEFRTSMVLFIVMVGTSRLKQGYRLLTGAALIVLSISHFRKDVLLFVSGMFIAELDVIRKASTESLPTTKSEKRQGQVKLSDSSFMWIMVFILGLFLGSAPVCGCEETYGFRTLSLLVPSCFPDISAFWRSIGAIFTTWAVANSDIIKPVFTNRFSLYLGKISFALYLVHGNVLKSLLFSAMPSIYTITHDGTNKEISTTGVALSWLLGAILTVPLTFWLSDLFWRGIDMPCVRFARWLEEKVTK